MRGSNSNLNGGLGIYDHYFTVSLPVGVIIHIDMHWNSKLWWRHVLPPCTSTSCGITPLLPICDPTWVNEAGVGRSQFWDTFIYVFFMTYWLFQYQEHGYSMFLSKVMTIWNSQLSLVPKFLYIELWPVEELIFITNQWQKYKIMSPKHTFLVQLE